MQEQYPNAYGVWIDAEFSFDREWALSLGINLDKLIVIRENAVSKVWPALCGKFEDGKKKYNGLLDKSANKEIDIKLVVVDSVVSLVPPKEEGRNFDEQEMSALAAFMPKGLRALSSAIIGSNNGQDSSDTAVVFINQAREKIGARFPTVYYTGGRALKHFCSLIVKIAVVSGNDGELNEKTDFGFEQKIGHKVRCSVEKSRAAPNGGDAEIWLDFSSGVTRKEAELVQLGAKYKVINKTSAVTYVFPNGHKTTGGIGEAERYLIANQDVATTVAEAIKSAYYDNDNNDDDDDAATSSVTEEYSEEFEASEEV